MPFMSRGRLAVVATAVLAAGATSAGQQQPTFRAGVDLVMVDVQVVDGSGQPTLGLAPSSFEVRIDGRRRQVVAAEVLRYSYDGSTTALGEHAARNFMPAEDDAPGRTFVLAIDSMSLSAGDGAGAVRAAQAFVDRLTPNDLVGVAMLPRGVSLGPTRDREVVRRALGLVVGLGALRPNQFHLSAAEVIDIVAESEAAQLSQMNAGRGGRGAVTAGDVTQGVQARECPSGNQGCVQGIVIDAQMQAHQMEAELDESIAGLQNLLALLSQYQGRKTVVLISGGMPVNDRPGGWQRDGDMVLSLGRAAALSSATVYAIYLDGGIRTSNNPERRSARPSSSVARDREVQMRVLDDFSAASGGGLLLAPTDAGAVGLARVLRETSTFYTLAVAPDPKDLDGRPHELRVNVSARGLTLRVPRFVVLRRG